MNKFPKTYCVSLKETPLRTSGFIKLAQKAGIDANIFYGVLGIKLGLVPNHFNEIEYPGQNTYINEMSVGCSLSHLMLWNHLKYQSENEFLIFEDDAVIEENFKHKFSELYDKLPENWQMVYVGWVHNDKNITPIKVQEGISIHNPLATHAYLIRKNALEILCDGITPLQSHIDTTIISRCLPKLQYYVFDPSLVSQRSHITGMDSTWSSLVYDWKTDLHGCKQKLMKDFVLLEGWFNMEQNQEDVWRWSGNSFSIQVPEIIDTVELECSVPVENDLNISVEESQICIPLKSGTNVVSIPTSHKTKIVGYTRDEFIPAQKSLTSQDFRSLGICLKKVKLISGIHSVPFELTELVSISPPPVNYKL